MHNTRCPLCEGGELGPIDNAVLLFLVTSDAVYAVKCCCRTGRAMVYARGQAVAPVLRAYTKSMPHKVRLSGVN